MVEVWLMKFSEIYAGYYDQIQLVTLEFDKGMHACLAQIYSPWGVQIPCGRQTGQGREMN